MIELQEQMIELQQHWKADWLKKASMVFELADIPATFKEIPNEYCGPTCCPHRVWLLANTPLGVFKLGWRKSVISLDWSSTRIVESSQELFPKEDVTKFDKAIHAWSYGRLVDYLERLSLAKRIEEHRK